MSNNVAPFDVQPRLTQIAMAIKPQGLIADAVLPRVPVEGEKFIYTKFTTEDMFTVPDAKVGRKGEPNQVEFGGKDVTDSTEDYGLDDVVPQKDVTNAEAANANFNPLDVAAENIATLLELAREQRVASLVFALGTYDSTLRTTLSGTSQWSDYTNSDPLSGLLAAMDLMLVRPTDLVIGQAAWTKLRQHPKLLAAIMNKGGNAGGIAAAGYATREAVADLLELNSVQVGQGFVNTAKPGQTPTYARVWGKHAALLTINRTVKNARSALPTFGFTAEFGGRFATQNFEPKTGLKGATRVRVGEQLKELVSFQQCGYFFQNASA